MSHHHSGITLELKLQIRYHGLKATQYFAKFTPESDAVFRQDLLTLRLPHPKRLNTTFISHGCIECVWPEVPKNGILHKNLKDKSDPQQQTLNELSISNITLKEIYPNAVKRNQLKRPREELPQPPPFTSQLPAWEDLPLLKPRGKDSQRPSKSAKIDYGDVTKTSAFSSKPPPRFEGADPSYSSNQTSHRRESTSTSESLVNGPSRLLKASISNIKARRESTSSLPFLPTKPLTLAAPPNTLKIEDKPGNNAQKATTTSNANTVTTRRESISSLPQHSASLPTKPMTLGHPLPYTLPSAPNPPSSSRDTNSTFRQAIKDPVIPTRPRADHDSPVKVKPPSIAVHTVKEEPLEAFIPPSASMPRKNSNIRENAQNSDQDRNGKKPHPPPSTQHQDPNPFVANRTIDKPPKEKGDILVQDFLKSLRLQMGTQNATALTAKGSPQTVDSLLKSFATDVQDRRISNSPSIPWEMVAAALTSAQGVRTSSSSLPPNEVPIPFNDSEVPPSRRPVTQIMKPSVLPTPPPSVDPNLSSSKIHPEGVYRPVGPKHTSTDQNLNFVPLTPHTSSASPPLAQGPLAQTSQTDTTPTVERQIVDMMGRKGGLSYNAHLPRAHHRIADSDFVTIQRLTREAWDIKRQITERVAREATIITELKALNSAWLPDPVKLGVDPSEEMKDRLAMIEQELEEEKRLRQEAENAIMDIRRECKTPFVVPSLLDAFVDISKLTTRALRPVDPTTSTNSGSSKDVKMEEILDAMSTSQPQGSKQTHDIEPTSNTSSIPKVNPKKSTSHKYRAKWISFLSRLDIQQSIWAFTPADVAEPGPGPALAPLCQAAGEIWHEGASVDITRLGQLLNQARGEAPELVYIVEHYWKCKKAVGPPCPSSSDVRAPA